MRCYDRPNTKTHAMLTAREEFDVHYQPGKKVQPLTTTNPAQPLLDLIDKAENATTGTAQAAAMQTLRAELDRTIAAYVDRLRAVEPPTVTDKEADQVLAALCKAFSIQPGYEPRLIEGYDRHEVSWEYGEIGWPREFIDHPDIDNLLPAGVWVDAIDTGRLAIYPRS